MRISGDIASVRRNRGNGAGAGDELSALNRRDSQEVKNLHRDLEQLFPDYFLGRILANANGNAWLLQRTRIACNTKQRTRIACNITRQGQQASTTVDLAP
jgi:hypothetical protein